MAIFRSVVGQGMGHWWEQRTAHVVLNHSKFYLMLQIQVPEIAGI